MNVPNYVINQLIGLMRPGHNSVILCHPEWSKTVTRCHKTRVLNPFKQSGVPNTLQFTRYTFIYLLVPYDCQNVIWSTNQLILVTRRDVRCSG
jgi:hypothetical protein